MKLLARVLFLILSIVCGLWFLGCVPRVLAAFKTPNQLGGAMGYAFVPLMLFFVFGICYAKLRPSAELSDPNAAKTSGGRTRTGFVVLFFGFLIGLYIWAAVRNPKDPAAAKYERFPEARNNSWAVRTLKDVTLETPNELQLSPRVVANEKNEYAELYFSESKEFVVGVSRYGFKPTFEPDFEGSVNAIGTAIKNTAIKAGDGDPKVEVKPTMLGKLTARSITYVGKSRSPLRMNAICVLNDKKIWQVMVTYQSDFLAGDAARVIKSVRVAGQ